MGYYDFPHTRNYDTDLGYLIKRYFELNIDFESLEKNFNDLKAWCIAQLNSEALKTLVANKLDEWLQDGTLASLINNALLHVTTYDTVVEMLTHTGLEIGSKIYCTGADTVNDGNGGHFRIRARLSTDVIDNYNLYLIDGSLNVAERIIENNYIYITPEQYGAKGDGVTDDSDALQAALNKCLEFGTSLHLLNKTYLISKNLNIDKTIGMIGNESPKSIIKSEEPRTLYIKNGGDNQFTGKLENIEFNNVGLVFGDTINDYGNQYICRDILFRGNINAITLKNNCWNMLFDNIVSRNVNCSFLFDFTNKINSGAAIKLNNCTCTDSVTGLRIEGHCSDGGDIWCINDNFEHNDYGYYCDDNSNDLFIYVFNTHFESNRIAGCYSAGANFSFNGGWGFYDPSISTWDSLFFAKNCTIFVSNMRLNSGDKAYYHTEGSGKISIDNNIIAPEESFYNNGGKGTNNYFSLTPIKVNKSYTISAGITNDLVLQRFHELEISGSIYVPGGAASTADIVFTNTGYGAPRVIEVPITDLTKNIGGNVEFNIKVSKYNISAEFYDINTSTYNRFYRTLSIDYATAQQYYFTDNNSNKNIKVEYTIK